MRRGDALRCDLKHKVGRKREEGRNTRGGTNPLLWHRLEAHDQRTGLDAEVAMLGCDCHSRSAPSHRGCRNSR